MRGARTASQHGGQPSNLQATNFKRKLYTLLNSGIALIGCEFAHWVVAGRPALPALLLRPRWPPARFSWFGMSRAPLMTFLAACPRPRPTNCRLRSSHADRRTLVRPNSDAGSWIRHALHTLPLVRDAVRHPDPAHGSLPGALVAGAQRRNGVCMCCRRPQVGSSCTPSPESKLWPTCLSFAPAYGRSFTTLPASSTRRVRRLSPSKHVVNVVPRECPNRHARCKGCCQQPAAAPTAPHHRVSRSLGPTARPGWWQGRCTPQECAPSSTACPPQQAKWAPWSRRRPSAT